MKRLVLLGGGHSHVEVLRRFGRAPVRDAGVVLVSSEPRTVYSGMLPGFVAGHYAFSDCHIELEPLCRAAGARFRRARAEDIDPIARHVHCSDGSVLEYDYLSINIGAAPESNSILGSREHAVPVKPLTRFVQEWSSILQAEQTENDATTIAVIGAGAGGVELILAIEHRLSRERKAAALHLLTDAAAILPDHGAAVRQKLERILGARGIHVHVRSRVTALGESVLHREHGPPLTTRHAVLATSASAPQWLARSGLQIDARGFVRVNAALQSLSHPTVFAAGDVASIKGHPLPKSGVYAVRQGPPLAENLRRALTAQPLIAYSPQSSTLALISTGNRYAVASWRAFAVEGRWVWRWKDRIDRRFIARYRAKGL